MKIKIFLFWSELIFTIPETIRRQLQPPMEWLLAKISSPNLIKPLDPTTKLQELQRTEEHAQLCLGMLSAKFKLWETLQDK